MKHISTALRATAIGAAAVASLGALVAPAHAAGETVANIVGNELQVVGSANADHIDVVGDQPGFTRVTNNKGVKAGNGCTQISNVSANCSNQFISQIRLSGGAGDDILHPDTGFFTIVLGGDGNDTIRNRGTGQARLNGNAGDDVITGELVDQLFGQEGNDRLTNGIFLRGGAGNDILRGLSGNDTLIGDDGFDTLDGGEGFDDLCLTGESNTGCEAF